MRQAMGGQKSWQRRIALILVVIAIVFWLWFGIGSAIVIQGTAFDWFMYLMMPGGIFIFSGLIAWRWNRIGGILLFLEGILALIFVIIEFVTGDYETSTFILMVLTLCLPPMVSGMLFTVYGMQILRSKLKEDDK